MKKQFTILLFFSLVKIVAQTNDSTHYKKTSAINYYSPFHKIVNDSAMSVSKFGHYFSVGTGAEQDSRFGGVALLRAYRISGLWNGVSYNNPYGGVALASYSLAYKSHLISATYGFAYSNSGLSWNGYSAKYFGLLYGQSIRNKHFMISVSAGLALTYLTVVNNLDSRPIQPTYQLYGKISFPVEVKAFWLARNGVGVGIHLAENIVATPKYSPFYAGLSAVFGFWNKPKPKRIIYCFQPSK